MDDGDIEVTAVMSGPDYDGGAIVTVDAPEWMAVDWIAKDEQATPRLRVTLTQGQLAALFGKLGHVLETIEANQDPD